MGQAVKDRSEICPLPPGPLKDLNRHLRPRTKFVAFGLSFILATSGLAYYLMQPSGMFLNPWVKGNHVIRTPHAAIAIDGDADFSATALIEGWPGDGSPENPFIIDGLDIDLGGADGHCISIGNTRVSFIISNCALTNGSIGGLARGAGICLHNVTNGELVNNTCSSNEVGIEVVNSDSNIVANNICISNMIGIFLSNSESNTVANNICNNNRNGIYLYSLGSNTVTNNNCSSNTEYGIYLYNAHFNSVVNNICTNNSEIGINFESSQFNTVAYNTCNRNDIGIELARQRYWTHPESYSNTVVNNTCNNNRIGIYIYSLGSNTVENNTCLGNVEHDIVDESELKEELAHKEFVVRESVWFLAGAGMILVVAVIAFVKYRRMEI